MRAKKSKKASSAKGKGKEKAEPLQEEKSTTLDNETDDGKLDFGGLPDRDLKKNLGGCG